MRLNQKLQKLRQEREKLQGKLQTIQGRLRQMDEEGVEALTCEVLPAEGIGLAIMNRLSRAAAFRTLDADKEIAP